MSGSGTGSGGGGVISPFAPAAGALSVLTTAGDLLIENATPANARLPAGAVNQMLGLAGSPLLPAWVPALNLQAATPLAGYQLINGTGTIISWTTPNDGQLHRVLLLYNQHVTSGETGGQIQITTTTPDSGTHAYTIENGGSGTGFSQGSNTAYLVAPNTAVTVAQSSALTAGAAVFWAEIWGS